MSRASFADVRAAEVLAVFAAAAPAAADGLRGWIAANHRCNALLWEEEDQARRRGAGDAAIVANKRAIDRLNQQRNDAVERIDEILAARISRVPREPGAWRNSETPGAMIDRLSILTLKLAAMRAEAGRRDAPDGHRRRCAARAAVLAEQRADLAEALDRLLDASERGRAWFKVYRQMKMYNDPALNPHLRRERAGVERRDRAGSVGPTLRPPAG